MQSLNTLVRQGKVLYLGISDTPAWVVVKANCYARQHGLRQFSMYQGRLSAQARDLEREIIPMCQAEGMGIHAWGVMGNGMSMLESLLRRIVFLTSNRIFRTPRGIRRCSRPEDSFHYHRPRGSGIPGFGQSRKAAQCSHLPSRDRLRAAKGRSSKHRALCATPRLTLWL